MPWQDLLFGAAIPIAQMFGLVALGYIFRIDR